MADYFSAIRSALSKRCVLALDGHDGSGKTTLAKSLATEIGATYVRPYAEPFGSRLLECAESKQFEALIETAAEAITHALKEAPAQGTLIFDRFWITLFTLLPATHYSRWQIKPPTAIIWADLNTTLSRLSTRDEEEYDHEWHKYYIRLYQELSDQQPHCMLIPTHQLNEAQALQHLVTWAQKHETLVAQPAVD